MIWDLVGGGRHGGSKAMYSMCARGPYSGPSLQYTSVGVRVRRISRGYAHEGGSAVLNVVHVYWYLFLTIVRRLCRRASKSDPASRYF